MKETNLSLLKEALYVAEETLKSIEDDENVRAKNKRKRITKAVEKAYLTLNMNEYTDKELAKRTDQIWESLLDENRPLAFLIFIFGIILSGTFVFTAYQTYSFIRFNLDPTKNNQEFTEELSSLVKVDYKEQSTVSLYDQMSVKDSTGLQNPPQEFSIKNDSSEVPDLNYIVNYYVYLAPLNDPKTKLIGKEYIKYKYSYKDSKTGKLYESNIGTLADLPEKEDGTLLLAKGTQNKDSRTDFKVIFWIGVNIPNEQQGSSYTFKFKVDADVAEAS